MDKLGGETAKYVDRVLDVRQGELCWVVGTVYMEMNLKPNVLDDISKEVCSPFLFGLLVARS
jgi:DNA polymerase delta subunit 2